MSKEASEAVKRSEGKRKLFLAMLAEEPIVRILIDGRKPGVFVPERFKVVPLALEYGLNLAKPIHDLQVNELGVFATLSFDNTPEPTFIPWPAVFAIAKRTNEGGLWHEDVPEDVLAKVVEKPVPAALIARLQVVPEDVGEDAPEVLYEAPMSTGVPSLRCLPGGKA